MAIEFEIYKSRWSSEISSSESEGKRRTRNGSPTIGGGGGVLNRIELVFFSIKISFVNWTTFENDHESSVFEIHLWKTNLSISKFLKQKQRNHLIVHHYNQHNSVVVSVF